jgi:hypothetical protein
MAMQAGSSIVAVFSLVALLGSGCGRGPRPEPPPGPGGPAAARESRDVFANSVFGRVDVKETGDLCAGRVRLAQGSATVNDACFTGDTNVVLCTDASSVNAVQCTAADGKLALAGTADDLINYARVR